MNKLIILAGISGAALTSVIAAPAMADDSTSTVIQSNTGNEANVDQTGSLDGASSLIDQSGASNLADVNQSDNGLAGVTPTNTSEIFQTGNGNEAYVIQKDSAQSSYIEQSSDGNFAEVQQGFVNDGSQDTSNNMSRVIQAGGGNNTAYVDQIQADNVESFVEQLGTNQMAMVDQSIVGEHDHSDVDQFGDNQFAEVLQPGDFNDSFVTQTGADNRAHVLQSGNDNYSRIDQGMSGNFARVDQLTDGNMSTVNQVMSTNGTVNVTQ
ncbi:MAG: hypothetical protein AAGL10_10845 [Pseudomonadota bacterium]